MEKITPPPGVKASTSWKSVGPILILTIVASLIPLLVTPVLPLTDFYAHIARYYILANLTGSEILQQNYEAAWQLLPNLGLDILGVGLMKILPPLIAAKLIAGLIIAAPFAGILYLARVLHGRVAPLTVLLAGLAAYNHILIWGFSNFLLGLGVLLGALGYWIAAQDRPGRQLVVTISLGLILFFIHGLAFALWGFLLSMVELSLAIRAGDLRAGALTRRTGRLALIAVGPVLIFLQTNTASGDGGVTGVVSNLMEHAERDSLWRRIVEELQLRIDSILRVADSTQPVIDRGIGALLWAMLATGLLTGTLRLDHRLWLVVSLCTVLLWLTPPSLFGVGHLGERIPLVLLAFLAAGLSVSHPEPTRLQRMGLITVMLLFLTRNAILTISWYHDGRVYAAYLDALERTDTGRLGTGAFVDDGPRTHDFRPNCRPLPSLLLLINDTAVPTFANPTQQPLRITGPLSQVREANNQIATDPEQTIQGTLAILTEAGADTVVTCTHEPSAIPISGFEIPAAAPPWILYKLAGAE